jgi:hypothetical protein
MSLQQMPTILKQQLQRLQLRRLNRRLNHRLNQKYTMKSLSNYLLHYRYSKPMENISLTMIPLHLQTLCVDLMLIYGGKHFAMKLKQLSQERLGH